MILWDGTTTLDDGDTFGKSFEGNNGTVVGDYLIAWHQGETPGGMWFLGDPVVDPRAFDLNANAGVGRSHSAFG